MSVKVVPSAPRVICSHPELPQPKRRHRGEVRLCPGCWVVLVCLLQGHLTSKWTWLHLDAQLTTADRLARQRQEADR